MDHIICHHCGCSVPAQEAHRNVENDEYYCGVGCEVKKTQEIMATTGVRLLEEYRQCLTPLGWGYWDS